MVLFIGFQEVFIVLLFVVVFFGADKIPEIARGLAKAIGYVKRTTDEVKREILQSTDEINVTKHINEEVKDAKESIESSIKDTIHEVEGTFKREL